MSGILPVINVSDVPETIADKYTAVGTIGSVTTKEVANGYVAVSIPLEGTDKSGVERRITARYNVKPEWFTPGFEKSSDYVGLSDGEKIGYQIGMKKLTRGLFAGAGLETLDFDTLEGATVGFSVGPNSKDKSKAEVKGFFSAK